MYARVKTEDRDSRVLERINIFMSKNVTTLSDGLIRNTIVIPADIRKQIAEPYNIGGAEWNEIKRSREFNNMRKLASELKLGLLISYCETQDNLFLNFFMILAYSSLISKYFKNGYDRNIMKYTIDMADARTDFKKHEGSLIVVVNKKVDTFVNLFKKDLSTRTPTDKQLREWLQSLTTRMNESIRTIAQKYYDNFNNPDIKIMMEYSDTDDGKKVISASGVMEAVRQNSVNNLMNTSDNILNMVGLPAKSVGNLKYRRLMINELPNNFGLMSTATSDVLDEWMKRNRNNITLQLFRTGFLKTMSVARGIDGINKKVEDVMMNMINTIPEEDRRNYNKQQLKKYIYLYILGNIYFSSKTVL